MRLKFTVTGMTCAACSARVEKVTRAVEGVQSAEVNLLAGTMVADVDKEEVGDQVIKAVQDAGYGAGIAGQKTAEQKPDQKTDAPMKEMKKRILGSAVFL